MRTRFAIVVIYAAVAALVVGAFGSLAGAQRRRDRAAAAAERFVADRGKFRVVVEGTQLATEEFQISRSGSDWVARGTTEIKLPDGNSARVRAELRLTAEGIPLRYEWSAEGERKSSAVITFRDGAAQMELRMAGEAPFSQDFMFTSPLIVLLDNNLYHQYAVLAGLYDWQARGAQSFPVLIPQDLTPGNIIVEAAGPIRGPDGAEVEMLRVRSTDLEVEVYLDSNRRLLRLAVPGANAEVIRE